jgi:hypothetical protein
MATIQSATEIRYLGGDYDEGSHFAARQEPGVSTTDLRAAFRSLHDEGRSS